MKKLVLVVILGTAAFGIGQRYTTKGEMTGFLDRELIQLAEFVPHRDSLNTAISKVDIAWHLDHTLKVINRIYDSLQASDPEAYVLNLNPARILVFTSGELPRGKGKAPASVVPPDDIHTQDILSQLAEAREKVPLLDSLHTSASFVHPVFGRLNTKYAKRFLEIHTQHHLKIIEDILSQPVEKPTKE